MCPVLPHTNDRIAHFGLKQSLAVRIAFHRAGDMAQWIKHMLYKHEVRMELSMENA